MPRKKYDFGGWATKNDLKCSDGRTIRKGAFQAQDGQKVPLVWQHFHDDPSDVLGHAILENREDGVYAYCYFNDSPKAAAAKEAVAHGDIDSLSIYANQLKQNAKDVVHGVIREVSLVIARANPGAVIDYPVLSHSDDGEDIFEEAVYSTGLDLEPYVEHADDDKKEDEPDEDVEIGDDETIGDILKTLSPKQRIAVGYVFGKLAENTKESDDDKGEDEMKHNAFDATESANYISHADMETVFKDAQSPRFGGSLKAAVEYHLSEGVLAHSAESDAAAGISRSADGTNLQTYGFDDPSFLFPEFHNLNNTPYVIDRKQNWVKKFMNGVHRVPYSRIRSTFADITADEARAKGYVKGNRKTDEVITLLRRDTTPQTVYKRQKMDRDDMLDITDFNALGFLKGEMRGKLDEEIARAAMIGDGRLSSSPDKIDPTHLRPVVSDDELFVIKVKTSGSPKDLVRDIVKAFDDYEGSGTPTMWCAPSVRSDLLLMEDNNGHFLYPNAGVLATTLMVDSIEAVPVFKGVKVDGEDLLAVIYNLDDYTIGADKGGSVEMFEDFDLDYNQHKVLIETRVSGALTIPHSAIVVTKHSST